MYHLERFSLVYLILTNVNKGQRTSLIYKKKSIFRIEHSQPYSPIQIPQNLHMNGREEMILVCMVNNNMHFITKLSLRILKQFKSIFRLDLLLRKKK